MDKVNGIEMDFIFKERGHSPETYRLKSERNSILKPQRTRIVGKGTESERIEENHSVRTEADRKIKH